MKAKQRSIKTKLNKEEVLCLAMHTQTVAKRSSELTDLRLRELKNGRAQQ